VNDKTEENKSVYRYLDCHLLEQERKLMKLLFIIFMSLVDIVFWLQKTNITIMT
jgi:hypothetical protein